MSPIQIMVDVTAGAGLGQPAQLAASVFLPERTDRKSPTPAAILVPGSTYTRRYYDLMVPGRDGYSAARRLAAAGFVVLTVDNLGTGESTCPDDGATVTLEAMAGAVADTARWLRQALRDGALHPDLQPVEQGFLLGVGHSLGGCVMTLQQGVHGACDAVAILGFSCQRVKHATDDKTGAPKWTRQPVGKGYGRSPTEALRGFYYHANVPPDVIVADEVDRTPMPDGINDVIVPGRSAPAAAAIETPVFLAFGDHDVSPDPMLEPGFYRRSKDITLYRMTGTAHCHNSASTRAALWDRLADWTRAQATAARAKG